MKKNNKTAKRYSSPVVNKLLTEITPVEKLQITTKMSLAARLDDLISERGWGKSEFAEKVNKNPSEITKWLSGTQNFTIDILSEIALALNLTIAELFAPKQIQVISKTNIVVAVKQVEAPIKYVTPYGDFIAYTSNYHFGNYQDAEGLSTSRIYYS